MLAPQHRILRVLDRFLSEPQRRAAASELARSRILAGAALFLLCSCAAYLLVGTTEQTFWPSLGAALGYLATLVLLRGARTYRAPAWMLCVVLGQALLLNIFEEGTPLASTHAAHMVLPALAVYLMGPRAGLVLTVGLALALGVGFPLHYGPTQPHTLVVTSQLLWTGHLAMIAAFLGAWGLSSLHSTARDAAQGRLERTLEALSASEGKLQSLIESTDDLVCSVDLEGRLLVANSAQKRLFVNRVGTQVNPGDFLFSSAPPEYQQVWRQRLEQARAGPLRFEEEYVLAGERMALDICISPIHDKARQVVGMTLFSRDITARKQAEERLGEMHRTLVDVSRQAGMAEIATGVLHNVGNTLNSVNISTSMLGELLRKSRVSGLAKAAQLLREHSGELGPFLASDPQGRKLPGYLIALSDSLMEEREMLSQELVALGQSVDHIKSIVTMQQKHARVAGTMEELSVPQLIDEALRLDAVSLDRLGIQVEREYGPVRALMVDRHKLLQILVNLLSNARHALEESGQQDKRLAIRVREEARGQRLLIEVADNGPGVTPENLERIFTQGFTTKKTGHGFGLHISALAANEMKGRLTCSGSTPGQGATFTLELPMADQEVRT